MKRTLMVHSGFKFLSGDGDNSGVWEIIRYHAANTYDCVLHLIDEYGFETGEIEQAYLTSSDILQRMRDLGMVYDKVINRDEVEIDD